MSTDTEKQKLFIRTYHDENCPKCDFPETTIVRDSKTMRPIAAECGNKPSCGWSKKLTRLNYKKVVSFPIKLKGIK